MKKGFPGLSNPDYFNILLSSKEKMNIPGKIDCRPESAGMERIGLQ